ncbi:hypothetical protein FIV34_16285 [Luteibacter pinisoli]|uniref:DUF4175 domain-containing protein n=1 Tax=Luteibacter pinisoli TaxID=2589080 RepID=A0A4Y5Z5F0_9GAMM|nr:hypothetical protein [Luteibacter pinisoli]QDE40652.1 hypothetical protein FIV34_16285 [Luteibacter pinisoli]
MLWAPPVLAALLLLMPNAGLSFGDAMGVATMLFVVAAALLAAGVVLFAIYAAFARPRRPGYLWLGGVALLLQVLAGIVLSM